MVAIETGLVAKAAASAAVTTLFKSAADRLGKGSRIPGRETAIRALAALQGYSHYLENTNDRVSMFKTFANPTQPVSVLDHFVTTEFKQGRTKKILTEVDLLDRVAKPARIVISATAGYGKSMVMRYLALSLYHNPRGRIPLFLELRHLNRITSPNLLAYLHQTYRHISDIQIEALRQGLAGGLFVLLLDGFDELNHELRPLIENQILELAAEFPNSSIVVSGRPDERFNAWRSFSSLKIQPMSKERVVELLHKLDYDGGTKKRFISKINKGLYETHESFLSTPLLAILMLLTYEQNANIPDKIHLFYAKAFETLFHKHDALKEQYDRSRKSALQVDEFERVFSVFCLKTYVLEKTEFTKAELLSLLREALKFEGLTVQPEQFLFDIEEAVCLVMKEGVSYFFVHRSFQEYFTAVFLANCPEETRDDFIDQVASRYWDSVLPMLFDMASAQLEPSWVSNKVDDYLNSTSLTDPTKISPLLSRFSGIVFYKSSNAVNLSNFMPGPFSKFVGIMRRFYPAINSSSVQIDYSAIERFGRENWEKLLPETESVHALPDTEDKITIKSVVIEKLPDTLPFDTGLVSLANHEFETIKKIRGAISDDQKAKNAFLTKLFSPKRTA